MIIVAIDPGFRQSAIVTFDGERVIDHEIVDNEVVLTRLEALKAHGDRRLVIEQISMGGMIAGAEVFETCFWSGRFAEMWSPQPWDRIKRTDIKLHVCGQMRAKDANVRQALIDRFGPGREAAIGTMKRPGPLYGIASHCWAALAVAVTWWDRYQDRKEWSDGQAG